METMGNNNLDAPNDNGRVNAWAARHPLISTVLSVMTLSIAIGTLIFAVCRFSIIDSVALTYEQQLSAKDDTIEQYKARVNFLENEGDSLKKKNDQYLEWLQSSPGNMAYLEKINTSLQEENEKLKSDLLSKLQSSGEQENEKKYEFVSGNIKVGEAVIDNETGISVCIYEVSSIGRSGSINISAPGYSRDQYYSINSGYSKTYKLNGKEYRVIVTNIDWTSSTYSVAIIED